MKSWSDIFTLALWRLLMMSLTVVLGSFFTAVTMFLSSTADVLLGLPVQSLLLSTPCGFFLLQDIPNGCTGYGQCLWQWLFPSSLSFTIAYFSPSSLVFMLVTRLTINVVCTGKTHIWNWAQTFSAIYCLNYQCNRTHQGNKTHLSVTSSNTFGHMSNGWIQTKGAIL